MNLCSDNHDEVCYEGNTCPVCSVRNDLQYEIDYRDKDIAKLNDKTDELYNQIDELKNKIVELQKSVLEE